MLDDRKGITFSLQHSEDVLGTPFYKLFPRYYMFTKEQHSHCNIQKIFQKGFRLQNVFFI